MKNKKDWIVKEESGQGLVEYSLIIVIIALGVLGGLAILSNGVYDTYNEISANIP